MASKARNLFLVISCLLPLLGPSCSKLADKLVHGKELKDGDELVSANENFIIRFFQLAGIAYLGIWYNRNNEKPVWDANRSTPIADKCSVLTIDDYGNLRISYIGYQSKILCSVQGESNNSAILLDVGNFVLYEGNSEGYVKRDLRPNTTDTHVPGMKVGENNRTRRSWPTTPKRNRDFPDLGSFTLNNSNQLAILWRGNIHCSTGPWFNGRSNSSSYGLSNQKYFNFGFISNENKTYFSENNCSWVDFGYAFDTRAGTGEIWRRDTSFRSNRSDGLRELCVPESKASRWWIWLIVEEVGTIITLFCIVILWKIYKAKGKKKMKQNMLVQEFGHAMTSTDLKIFSFESITVATNNFSTENRLGMGGFGPVYKGKLVNEQEIAIKRLSRNSRQGLMELENEVILIAKLQHTNLVTLLGFCIQEEEKILIYEYMANKSLDFFLFDSTKRRYLNWKKRINIIEGIAQALVYLHKYSKLKVIHRDLKASNILLDDEMNPKISDFGLAIKFGLKESEQRTNRPIGTFGYMAPEYAMNGIISTKVDVFSYGVLLVEILTGKKNNNLYDSDHPLNLIGHAWQLWNEGRGIELIDITLNESCSSNEALRCIHIGLLCVQENAADRPAMQDVICMLFNETIQLPTPKQPAFFMKTVVEEPMVAKMKKESFSINDVTISGMDPR